MPDGKNSVRLDLVTGLCQVWATEIAHVDDDDDEDGSESYQSRKKAKYCPSLRALGLEVGQACEWPALRSKAGCLVDLCKALMASHVLTSDDPMLCNST